MTDLTEAQRIERGRRAEMALAEFLDPAFEAIGEAYLQRLEDISAREPWATGKIAAVANAIRITKELRTQIVTLVHDGGQAKAAKVRTEKIEAMSPARRRLLQIGAY